MQNFKTIDIKEFDENFFKLIGDDYALITVDDGQKINMMTASWGFCGVMWYKNVVNIVVRPSRYTYEYLTKNPKFTLNFLSDGYDDVYSFCGSKSGRDCDKVAETSLQPIKFNDNLIAFKESKYVFECNTLYVQKMSKDCFCDSVFAEKKYPNDDVHTMFIAEIENVYVKSLWFGRIYYFLKNILGYLNWCCRQYYRDENH